MPEPLPNPGTVPPPRPTLAVWLATGIVAVQCLYCLGGGLTSLAAGVAGAGPPPPTAPQTLSLPPLWGGILAIAGVALAVGFQLAAVLRGGVIRSAIAGVGWVVLGVLACLVLPDPIRVICGGAWLFVGITMLRWAWKLARRRTGVP